MKGITIKKKALPITPECFYGNYLALVSTCGHGDIEYLCSDKDFDFETNSFDEETKSKFEFFANQIASAFTREIGIHLRNGNTDHWLFTFGNEGEKDSYDLLISQQYLNEMNEEDYAVAVYMLALFLFKKVGEATGSYGLNIHPIGYLKSDTIN